MLANQRMQGSPARIEAVEVSAKVVASTDLKGSLGAPLILGRSPVKGRVGDQEDSQ